MHACTPHRCLCGGTGVPVLRAVPDLLLRLTFFGKRSMRSGSACLKLLLFSRTKFLYPPVSRCLFPGARDISFTPKSSHRWFVCDFLRFTAGTPVLWRDSPILVMLGGSPEKFLVMKPSGALSSVWRVLIFENFDSASCSSVSGRDLIPACPHACREVRFPCQL